ncbi:MAG: methylated-DNA--[protein]-cysteine S-methyltransferase [Pseudomonadales bacterium]
MPQENIRVQTYKSPVGELLMGSYAGKLVLCDWRYRKMRAAVDKRLQSALQANYSDGDSSVLAQTREELQQYFAGDRQHFDVALQFVGSPFQCQVWQQLCQLNYGETCSYLSLAQRLGDAKKVRAAAAANGANAISILVPCHRIIGSDGKLVGYAGGLPAKRKLLELEGALSGPEQQCLAF